MASSFNAGGLASGIDTNSIVTTLTKLQSRPLELLQTRQAAMRSQVSLLGDLSGRMGALKTALSALGTSGAIGVTPSTNTGFALTPGTYAAPGSYQIAVTGLASAAKERSQAFAASTAPVTGGTLSLNVKGTTTDVAIADGASLDDVALQINQSGAMVTASVISDGTSAYLSITNRDTGFPPAGLPADALVVSMAATGSLGQALATTTVNPASNATFTLDGLPITRQTNTIADAVPGASLTLKALSAAETGQLTTSVDGTAKNLAALVTAYNDIIKAVQKQVSVAPGSNRSATLAGDGTLRGLQGALQRLVTTEVPGSTDVRSLADLGIKSARDGTISLDTATLTAAVARNPGAVNQLFSQATTGLSAVGGALVQSYVNATDGLLTTRSSGLNKSIGLLDKTSEQMQLRIDNFRTNLIAQFTAMESTVSNLKSIGNFLSSQVTYKVQQ